MPTHSESRVWVRIAGVLLGSLLDRGEPSARELKNRQEFEALLTAISLRNKAELERDAQRIVARHQAGELSDAGLADLESIIAKARTGNWAGAEREAYDFREKSPYFR